MEEKSRKYIKYQNTLMVAGQSAILLCIWSVIKFYMYLTVDKQYLEKILEKSTMDELEWTVTVIVVVIILAIGIWLRFLIGASAIKVAKGGKWKKRYLIFTVIYIVLSIASIAGSIGDVSAMDGVEDISRVFMELVCVVVFGTILYVSYQVYRCRKSVTDGRC